MNDEYPGLGFITLSAARTTLILNVCALVVATAVAVEGAYIVYGRFGVFRPTDYIASFVPAFVMFIVRNRTFSFWFLLLYCATATEFLLKAQAVYLGTYHHPGEKDPLQTAGLLMFFSIGCLMVYLVGTVIRMVVRRFRSGR